MKKLLFVVFVLPVMLTAQTFNFSTTSLDFQSVYYTQPADLKVTLENISGEEIHVTGVEVFSLYDTKPFFVTDSTFTMLTGESRDLDFTFDPEQNILHQMVAVIKTDYHGDYVINLTGKGKYLKAYYNDTYNKSEESLKSSLKTITGQGYQSSSYNAARDEMYGTIDNDNGDVTCVYTGRVATFNTRAGANSNSFNCEHTFPQSFFSQNLPMRSDLHHLYSTDVTSNSRRSNYPFGVVTGTPTWTVGGSKQKGSLFEPRDDHKGAVARSLFYFVIRYQDYSSHVSGQEAILRTWMEQDPPSQKYIDRNDDIYAFQNNRNPFVDYPQFIKRITSVSGNSVETPVKDLYVSRTEVDMESDVSNTIFTVSVVNTGNSLVTLSDFAISNTANFEFVNAMSNQGLFGGEGFEIQVRAKPSSNTTVNEQLTFNTDVAGMATVTIDLKADWLTVSTQDLKIGSSLNLFPNPTSNSFQVEWENQSNFELEMYNVAGAKVYSQQVTSQNKIIDVSDLNPGVYMVKTISGNTVNQERLVIE